ncbi:MAG: hypothetical protein P4M14_03085 [Gammaproteobacteria bacterium]|nr:hypothetical protein [Gammaproteobacteria bacterium]
MLRHYLRMNSMRSTVATAVMSEMMSARAQNTAQQIQALAAEAVSQQAAERSVFLPVSQLVTVNPSFATQALRDREMRNYIQTTYEEYAKQNGIDLENPLQKTTFLDTLTSCTQAIREVIPVYDPAANIQDAHKLLMMMTRMSSQQSFLPRGGDSAHPHGEGPQGEGPGGSQSGEKKQRFWDGFSAKHLLMGGGAIGVGIGALVFKELTEDPMVPADRLSSLLGIDAKQANAMVEDTRIGRTSSSRLRESDVVELEKVCTSDAKIKAAIEQFCPERQPSEILVQFAGSGQQTEKDFIKLEGAIELAQGVRIGKIPGSDQVVVAIDGPGTRAGLTTALMGTQPTPTGMAACANEVVKRIQALRDERDPPLKVNIETFSRGGSAGAIYTQLNTNNKDIGIDKIVMFDPEQGPNVSNCDRLIAAGKSVDVVRSGANQYNLFSAMPATQLVTTIPLTEHHVLTDHGGTKDCAGPMEEFQHMLMTKSSSEISAHLQSGAMKINMQAVAEHRLQDSIEPRDVDHPVGLLSETSQRMGYQMFNSVARMEYAQKAVEQVNAAMKVTMLAMVSVAAILPESVVAPPPSSHELR